MTQLAFDFEALYAEANADEHGGDIKPRECEPAILACGKHEYTPAGKAAHIDECLRHVCPSCGEHAPTEFVFNLNHGIYQGGSLCTSQELRRNHVWSSYQKLEAILAGDDSWFAQLSNCRVEAHGHKDSYKRGGWPLSCMVATLIDDRKRALSSRVPVGELPPIHEKEKEK